MAMGQSTMCWLLATGQSTKIGVLFTMMTVFEIDIVTKC